MSLDKIATYTKKEKQSLTYNTLAQTHHLLSLPRYCTRGRYREDGFSILQFFKSAVTCEFIIICKALINLI